MRIAFWVVPLLLTAVVHGQESPADRVAPYLTEDVIAVVRVDLTALDVDKAFERLSPFLKLGMSDPEGPRAALRGAVGGLRGAGASEIFVVASPADFPADGPYLVIPAASRESGVAIADRLRQPGGPLGPFGETAEVIGAAVVAGPKSAIDRLKERNGTMRPELKDAFSAVGDAPMQAVVTLSDDHRRALREMLPDLPEEFGGAAGERLAAAFRWAGLGVSFDPELSAKVVVQSESEQSAELLRTAITESLRRLSTEVDVLKAFPAMPLFVGSLIPERQGDRLVLVADPALKGAAQLLGQVAGAARAASGDAGSMNNLKQFGLAFHNFLDVYGSLPPNAGYDGDKPLLSWRVYLLPWLEQGPLYSEFRLDEPWDSEHNRKLIARMPDVFKSPSVPTPAGHTVYLVPTGEGLIFGAKAGTPFQAITDGTSNTILVVEATATKAVPWTKPEDLAIDPASPLSGLTEGRENFRAAFCDGSANRLPATIAPETFYHLVTPAGGEVADWR